MTKQMKKQQSIPQKIGSALATLACVCAILLCTVVLVQVYTQGYVNIAGFSMFRVVTGSMEPTIPVGSLLLSQDVPISQIETDDVVCFVSEEPRSQGKIITHRVVNVMEDSQGAIVLETKGDANLIADGYFVSSENLIGRVIWHTKEGNIMAGIMSFLSSGVGFLLCVVFPVLLVAGFILRSCVRNIRKEMDTVMQELEQEDEKNAQNEEDYEAMKERVRRELLEEFAQGAKNHEDKEEPETIE